MRSDPITDPVLLLRDLLQERTGLFFRDFQGLDVLVGRLTPRLEKSGCESFLEYYQMLSDGGPAATDEWLHVVATLAKNKTSFLRHASLAQSLVDVVIPDLVSRGFTEPLRIWSAACSTGEEPLTIAMALAEAGWSDRIQVEILASDASFVVVEKARRGVYGESRIRDLSPELRFKYFASVDEGWQVKPELHNRISWSVVNLITESEVAEFAASHIIICRNVFIYFSEPAIYRTLSLFGKQMAQGGYLLTDEGDYFASLISQVDIFERLMITGASGWTKRIENTP